MVNRPVLLLATWSMRIEVDHKKRQLRERVCETLQIVQEQADLLETTPPDPHRQFAAAGLMRCGALLRGICVLEDASLGALVGILERQLWETWLVSLHVLLRGDEALREVAGDDIFYKRDLTKHFDLGAAYQSDWEGRVAKLNYKQLAESLKPLLIQAGETVDIAPVMGYVATYRVQSLFAMHAGLATIGRFIRYGETSWSVDPTPPAPFDDNSLTPALYMLHLAKYVFNHFRIATDAVEAAWDELIAYANPGGPPGRTE